jgi:hypothetical protein
MTTSTELFAAFNEEIDESQAVVDTRILIPEMTARCTVLSAEFSKPELRNWEGTQYYSSRLAVTFYVDEAEAREATGMDKPRLFHNVKINFTMDGKIDWNNNIDLINFFKILGVKIFEGSGKTRKYIGKPSDWVLDAEGRSLTCKIVHEVTKAQNEVTGAWTEVKLDDEGNPVMKAVVKGISPDTRG